MTTWNRVQGDINDTLVARCDGVEDLTGITAIEAHVWRPTTTDPATVLTATVLDAVARTVTVNLSPWLNTATPASWQLEIQATWPGPVTVTFPAGRPSTIIVRKQGA